MVLRELLMMLVLGSVVMLVTGGEAEAQRPTFRKPAPDGVIEVIGVAGDEVSDLVELKDGSLMLVNGTKYRISTDGGQSWGQAQPLNCEGLGDAKDLSLIRLQSGALALAFRGKDQPWLGDFYLFLSKDEGQSWGPGRLINPSRGDLPNAPLYGTLIQLSSGRLVWPTRCGTRGTDSDVAATESGTWRGMRTHVTSNCHGPSTAITLVYYSDDEGQTWQRSANDLFGWFDSEGIVNGYGGITPGDEPNVVETADGRVLCFMRSTVGRIVSSYSSDGGGNWTAVRPTELASSYSPSSLVRIPETGDLMCVWNQVSGEELRRGYCRGRLSVAISQDSGATWGHSKTLEVSEGLEDVARVYPDPEIRMVRGSDDLGPLPEGFVKFFYPHVCFAKDKVYIMYCRQWIEEKDGKAQWGREQVLRVYPLEWFYE